MAPSGRRVTQSAERAAFSKCPLGQLLAFWLRKLRNRFAISALIGHFQRIGWLGDRSDRLPATPLGFGIALTLDEAVGAAPCGGCQHSVHSKEVRVIGSIFKKEQYDYSRAIRA
jgi:hypothetical protein